MTPFQKEAIDYLKQLRNGQRVDWDYITKCINTTADLIEEHDNKLSKDLQQKKQYLICTACLRAWSTESKLHHVCNHPNPELIRVREIV